MQRLKQMSVTLASGSVTESLHLIQDLLISQLRLTGTCGYLSDGFCYTNNSHAFQITAVRYATSIICRSQADSCTIRTSIKISIRWKQSLKCTFFMLENGLLYLLSNQSLCIAVFERCLPFACPKGVHFSASGTLLYIAVHYRCFVLVEQRFLLIY